jgi:hypothetical protein
MLNALLRHLDATPFSRFLRFLSRRGPFLSRHNCSFRSSVASSIRAAPIARHDFRIRNVSGSNACFNSSFERGELLLVKRHQLRVKKNNGFVTATAPGEAFDKRRETFATRGLRVDTEAVSHAAPV